MDRVHGPGPWRGPWTRSTGVVHGPGVHVLYTSLSLSVQIDIYWMYRSTSGVQYDIGCTDRHPD